MSFDLKNNLSGGLHVGCFFFMHNFFCQNKPNYPTRMNEPKENMTNNPFPLKMIFYHTK